MYVVHQHQKKSGDCNGKDVGQHNFPVQIFQFGQSHVDEHGDNQEHQAKEAAKSVSRPDLLVKVGIQALQNAGIGDGFGGRSAGKSGYVNSQVRSSSGVKIVHAKSVTVFGNGV